MIQNNTINKQKYNLTDIGSTNATNYLTKAANSLHIDYMDFAKITVKRDSW